MKPLKKDEWVAIIVLILVFQILALWCIDVSIPAIVINAVKDVMGDNQYAFLTNGFVQQNPTTMYHIALFWLVISSFCEALIVLHLILRKET